SRLGGGVTFDGRAIDLSQFALETPDATLIVDGALALLVAEPHLDARFSGHADADAIARWSAIGESLSGTLRVEGSVTGAFSAPAAKAHVSSPSLSRPPVALSDVSLDFTVDARRLDVTQFEATVAEGRISGTGGLTFASEEIALSASWEDLSVNSVFDLAVAGQTLQPAGLATGSATIAGAGFNPAAWRIDAGTSIAATPPAPGHVPVPGRTVFHVADGRWRIESDHAVEGATIGAALEGTLDAQDLWASSIAGTVSLRSPDLPRVVDVLGAADLLGMSESPIDRGRLQADATLSGSIASPRFDLAAEARELAGHSVSDVSGEISASGTMQRTALEARVRQGAANALTVTGTVWPRAARLDGRAAATLADPRALAPDIPLSGALDLQLEGAGPFDAITGHGIATIADARYDDFDLGRVEATLTADKGAARIAIVAPELSVRAEVEIARTRAAAVSADLRVEDADLERILRGAKLPSPITGSVSARAHAEGALDRWREGAAALDISSLAAAVGELPIDLKSARVTYDRGTIAVASFAATVGGASVSVAGRYPLLPAAPAVAPNDALQGTIVGDLSQAIDALRAANVMELPDLAGRGPLSFIVRVTGAANRPVPAANLEIGPAEVSRSDLPPVGNLRVSAHLVDGWIEVTTASADWQQAQLAVEGGLPLRLLSRYLPETLVAAAPPTAAPGHVTGRATGLTPRVLEPFVDADVLADIEGTVDASVRLEAPTLDLDTLRGEARLDRFEARAAGLPVVQREPTRIVVDRGVARVADWNWSGQGASLAVQGEIQLRNREAALQADGRADLRMLTPFVRDTGMALAGTVASRVSVSGALDEPTIEGELTVADGELRLRDPDLLVTDLSAGVSLTPALAQLTSLSGFVNGGTLTGTGEVTYGRASQGSARLTTAIRGMGLEFPEGLRAELNTDLTLAVAAARQQEPRGSVTGTATVLRGAYREPLVVVTGLLSALRAERLAGAVAPRESWAQRLDLNVRVVTDSDVIVDNNLARLQLGGDLRVIGTAAAPALSGRASLREGGELFIGSNQYTIESGTIDFANPVAIEPDLNLRAHTRAGGEEIELTLRGTPATLDVDLRSLTTPELGQADVASLLLTGRRLDEVPGAEAQIDGEQVLGYLSGDVLGAASRIVGLDTIRLGGADQTTRRRDPAAIATNTDPTSRLTFGKSFGNTLDITFSQSLRNGDAQTWIVDYSPIPEVDLRLVSDDANLRSYEFRHDVSIGAAVRPRTARTQQPQDVEVTTVSLTGELDHLEAALRDTLRLEPGERFDFSAWRADRDRLEQALYERGRLEARVAARRQTAPAGVALTYEIDVGPATAISVSGYPLSADTTRAIAAEWTRSVFDDFLRDETAAIVRRALSVDGYLQPQIQVSLTTDTTKTMAIAIDPGARATERSIAIHTGDRAMDDEL
ncbi:MAG: translocation/assembly module TamB domain-containing protein, partial [Acidobacteria bacterium]|nr:translocation/assembly module TamB domain-containing protein [Acidobacteriota bacterium]